MSRAFASIAFVGLLSFPAVGSSQTTPNDPTALEHLLSSLRGADNPGCVLGAKKDGQTPLIRVWGLADLEQPAPITANTIFEAGSVSKQFTAAAVALLASEGRLSLDDDIRRYLPEMPDYGTRITIRNLLNHTSGLRGWNDLVELQGWEEGSRAYTQDYVLHILARQKALNFKPGEEFLYSNSNYVLAALIVERVSGMRFASFEHDRLFAPLGMIDTRWRDDYTDVVPRRAVAYSKDASGAWKLDMPFLNVIGPGGLLTTVPDLLRWNDALSRPTSANAAWIALLQQPGRLNSGATFSYALGLELDDVNGVAAVGHAGATAGYRAYAVRVPSASLSLALLCNAGSLNTEDLGPQVAGLFMTPKTAIAAPPTSPGSHDEPGLSAKVAGAYRNLQTDALVTVSVENGGIVFNNGSPFRPVDSDHFRNASGNRVVTIVGSRPTRLDLTRVGNSDVHLERVRDWTPNTDQLDRYVGDYASSEIEATISIQRVGDHLEGMYATGGRWRLAPLYNDVFDAPDSHWTLRFKRDDRGQLTGFAITSTRTRRVEFAKSQTFRSR